MNTPTPETDAAKRMYYAPALNAESYEYVYANFARKLERERDLIKGNWHTVSDERDRLKSLLIRCEAERDQLRTVCDEYYFALTDEQVNKAEDNYNSLPHVKARTGK